MYYVQSIVKHWGLRAFYSAPQCRANVQRGQTIPLCLATRANALHKGIWYSQGLIALGIA